MSASREYPSRPICGVGVVVRKGDAVLLVRRSNPPRQGEWSIPGGAVELGEVVREAARREVHEECGIEISLDDVAEVVDSVTRDNAGKIQYQYVLIDFAGTYVSGELQAMSDGLEARWVSIADLPQYPIPSDTRHVIEKAISIKGNSM